MSDDLILPFERRLNTQTEVEVLALYLSGKLSIVKISDKLQERLTRLETCRDIYHQKRDKYKTVESLMMLSWSKANGEKYTISQSTAYRDFDDMVELFGVIFKTGGLNFHLNILLSNIEETRKKALIDHDWRTAAACDKNYIAAMEKFFSNQDAEKYKSLQPPVIMTDFIPEQSKVKLPDDWEAQVKRLIEKKKNKLMNIEDAQVIKESNERFEGGE